MRSEPPTLRRILPLVPEEEQRRDQPPLQYIFEPDPETVLEAVLPRLLAIAVYQAILENIASEQSARMVAMKAASDNAGKIINELQLIYNKTRQAGITKELSEIVGGAAAV